MKRTLIGLLLLSLISLAFNAPQAEPRHHHRTTTKITTGTKDGVVPEKAREVLRIIRQTGKPPAEYVGGRVWQNRERNLPRGGQYHEYDIYPKIRGKNRGPERLVIDVASGKAWYTPDHYRTFILIK
jgi:guanyl-specific ribonuclease Sa